MAVRITWQDVYDKIHKRILDSSYAPGDKLPRDEDIAQELGCARSTVQRAMRELSEEGIVERRRKGGTHVRSYPVTRATFDISVTRHEVESAGKVYSYQLINREIAKSPRNVMAAFGLTAPKDMLRIEALHLSDRQPYIYEDRWVCTDTVPEIANVDLQCESANEWLVLNRPYDHADLRFYAQNADAYHADLLDAQLGVALFVMERTTWIGTAPITTVKAVTSPGYQLITRT
ncbi:MAG: GntR family transcriptional regulator [Litoreibacter sp.]|nr:GntR family transcriptional regulator [Litoreibacter sp.]